MSRFVLATALAILAGGPVLADAGVPPPAGYKQVPVDNKIGIGQEFLVRTVGYWNAKRSRRLPGLCKIARCNRG